MGTHGAFRVVEAHTASYPVAMVVSAGNSLEIDRKRSEFPGWVWGRDSHGIEAWVPEGYLEVHGGDARFLVDYDSAELTVSVGEVVDVIEVAAGWSWCRHTDGRMGWIPTHNLVPVS